MANIGWRFPPLSGGTRQGYTNNDIEGFKGEKLFDNLAREICQNSLDARLGDQEPVRVVFKLRMVSNVSDVFSQYERCLEGCRNYWEDEMDAKLEKFVQNAEKTLSQDNIPILVASDYNTKGLSGSHSRKKSSSWEALTGSDGISVKSDKASAGSYGIGKNAPFACSSLSMVFYNTLAEDGESAFIGVARLATLYDDKKEPTQRVGRYQVNDNEKREWNPIYPENDNEFRDIFRRDKSGTDVIIVGFSQPSDWLPNVKKAVLKNFFVAISENKLIVELENETHNGNEREVIDADSISQMFSNLEGDSSDREIVSASQLYKAFTAPTVREKLSVLETDDVEVYIRTEESFGRKIANFRATGMLVGTYWKKLFLRYAVVVVIRKEKLGELLKDTEPPCHDKWDYKQIDASDRERRIAARNAIEKIREEVLSLLRSQIEDIPEKKIDAAGVGNYLPDDLDDVGGQPEGEDILRPIVKIGRIKTSKIPKGTTTQIAVQEEGTEKPGEIRNQTRHPDPSQKPKPSVPVDPLRNDPETKQGASPGKGPKTIISPYLTMQRAFPINSSEGLYKIVIKPSEDYDNLFVECFVVGEDGTSDPLEMENFTHNGTVVPVSGGKAGPLHVKAETAEEFIATFLRKEKMMLRLHLTVEVLQ